MFSQNSQEPFDLKKKKMMKKKKKTSSVKIVSTENSLWPKDLSFTPLLEVKQTVTLFSINRHHQENPK